MRALYADPTNPKHSHYIRRYWPQGAEGDRTTGAIAYFRAENGTYTVPYTLKNGLVMYHLKSVTNKITAPDATTEVVYPANDTQISETSPPFVNPKSIQIFSSGMDTRYASTFADGEINSDNNDPRQVSGLRFPAGGNYINKPYTCDDITNFTGGTLEDAIP
jgi:hypothetical protein